jgi:hypothetical protein
VAGRVKIDSGADAPDFSVESPSSGLRTSRNGTAPRSAARTPCSRNARRFGRVEPGFAGQHGHDLDQRLGPGGGE